MNACTIILEQAAVNMVRYEYTSYKMLLEMTPHSRNVETSIMVYHTVEHRTIWMIARNIPQLRTAANDRNPPPTQRHRDPRKSETPGSEQGEIE